MAHEDFQIENETLKVYKRRWIILTIYILYSAANSFQWMEYPIISSIVTRYYHITPVDVNWTSIIYMAVYPVIVLPVSYIIETKGLRVAALFGGIGTALAAIVKVFSIGRNSFYMILLGQTIGSTAQVFVLCLPSKIAAVWFKPNEVSTACSLAVFGTQLGFALGFILPPFIVKNHEEITLITDDLRILCYGLALYMIIVSIAIICYFPAIPPLPPSVAQIDERKKTVPSFKQHWEASKQLCRNKGFLYHMIAYGLNIGVFAAIGTFLNEFILYYFPNSEEDAGRIGLLMVAGGMIGSVLFGILLDKTHRYKETTLVIYIMAVISTVLAMFCLKMQHKPLVYITFLIVGIFTNAYMPVGFEFAVEITFPADESTTTGLLNAMTQAFGVVITLLLGKLNQTIEPFWSLGSQALLLFIGATITCLVPNTKKRQEALNQCKPHVMKNLL